MTDSAIKKTLELELEVTTTSNSVNRYQKIIDLARAIDAWRIFPRIFITTYIFLLYKAVIWFMELSDPNTQQAGLISVIVGAGAAWFGLYTGSGSKILKREDN